MGLTFSVLCLKQQGMAEFIKNDYRDLLENISGPQAGP